VWSEMNAVKLKLKKVSQITCGWGHDVLLTKDGIVYTFGHVNYGQTGFEEEKNQVIKRSSYDYFRVHKVNVLPKDVRIVQISASGKHTLCVSNVGRVYGFGNRFEKRNC
jgi:alpha-tubulin suppressor-like RCC1 family protein